MVAGGKNAGKEERSGADHENENEESQNFRVGSIAKRHHMVQENQATQDKRKHEQRRYRPPREPGASELPMPATS